MDLVQLGRGHVTGSHSTLPECDPRNTGGRRRCNQHQREARRSWNFFGYVFSDDGISSDPNKVEGVVIFKHQPLRLKCEVC